MKYIVHGATGAQGSPLFNKLFAEDKNVVAAMRNPGSLQGVQAVKVDLDSVNSLVSAYTDAEGIFVHLPLGSEETRLQYARNIGKAVEIAKPKRVVISTSGWTMGDRNNESALPTRVRETEKSGVSMAFIAPRLYLENLLLPIVIEPVKTEGVLSYPLRSDHPVSWCSHLDIADAAAVLLTNRSVTGIVGVGQLPAITGDTLKA